ncbi:DUF456 domain-containing protein [Actomonas aquatica]|uniref:DUF456 domain-containing protein n=1 Tax=Actomonas aquatica TaxID=2866162 RepID=A0ABZ1CE80_9BACT|nr:DUF456 domain-containing protein [Opitutus sp. WL0086]WRQ89793.1 DUF456 domain-containing protein [Opitutus sp. WL0086]
MELAVWLLTTLLLLAGLLGVLIPIIPGTTLMLLGVIVHKLLLPESLTWTHIGWVGLVWFVSVIVDFAGVLVGTRLFGGTKWGMAGASGGAFLGMFFSLPALLLGTIFGAVVAERYAAKRTHQESLRAGMGAAVGFVLSTAGRLVCAFTMIGLFLFTVQWPEWPTWLHWPW